MVEAKIVPIEPTEAMWGGLARAIVQWSQFDKNTGAALFKHLHLSGIKAPTWLMILIPSDDHVPPKGDIAVAIYKAMLDAAPPVHYTMEHARRDRNAMELASTMRSNEDEGWKFWAEYCRGEGEAIAMVKAYESATVAKRP